jgi:TrmH family RNA methyltransferase
VLVRVGDRSAEAEALLERLRAQGVPTREESSGGMTRMSEGLEPPELIASIGPPLADDLPTLMKAPDLVLVLIGLRYPGNVGFILRSAEVAGVAGIVVANDWGEGEWAAALRVGMHPDRFLPILRADAAQAIAAARTAGRRIVAVETTGDVAPWAVDLARPTALLLGGERDGLPAEALAQADAVVRIPSGGFIPSYNVQAATGILLGEWLRQREVSSSG